jgi:hypothetical protein
MMRWLFFAVIAATAPAALAQEPYQPPRTVDGRPDFSGTWGASFMTLLERPGFLKTLVLTEEEARKAVELLTKGTPDLVDPDFFVQDIKSVAQVRGEYRSSLLVLPADGQMPYTEKGIKLTERADWMDTQADDNPEERTTFDRCLAGLGQPPIRQIPAMVPNTVLQTPREIVILTEDVGSLRVIHTDGSPPPPAAMTSYEGWSAGRWEGDTLVVETTHIRADDPFRGGFGRPVLVEPDSKLTERFTRVSPTELLYQFTVEDSDLYTAPWLAEYSFTLLDTTFYEYACHEANYSMVNILLGGRQGDKRDAAKAKAGKPK